MPFDEVLALKRTRAPAALQMLPAHLAETGRARLERLKALMVREGRAWVPPALAPALRAEGEFASAR